MTPVARTKILLILSYFFLATFVICYLTIGFYNRHCADDYDAIYDVNTYGIFGAIKNLYTGWEGSYTQGLVYYTLSAIFKNSVSLFWYNLFSLLFLFTSFILLISDIGKKILNISSIHFSLLTTSLFAALFFTSPRLCETWYWLCGSASYLWPLTILFFALYFLFNIHKSKWHLFFACLLFFIFAGSRLNYPVLAGVIYFSFLFKSFRDTKKINYTLLLPFLCLAAGALIYIAAPGNYVRRSYVLPHITGNTVTFAGQMAKGIFRIVLYNNIFQLPYMLFLLSPMLLAGYSFSENISEKIKRIPLLKVLAYLFIGYFMLIVVHTFIMNFSLGDAGGSPRTRLLLHLIFTGIISFFLFFIGIRLKGKRSCFIPVLTMICTGIFLFVYKLNHELPVISEYAEAVDLRMEKIMNAKSNPSINKTDKLYLPLLPPSQTFTFNDPLFSEFKDAGILTYFKSIPNGSLHTSDIGTRKSAAADTVIDIYRKDHINVKLERTFYLPFKIDVDTLPKP